MNSEIKYIFIILAMLIVVLVYAYVNIDFITRPLIKNIVPAPSVSATPSPVIIPIRGEMI